MVIDGEERPLFDVTLDGETVVLAQLSQTALGRFVDPDNPTVTVMQNVRLSRPVETLTAHPQNYRDVIELQGLDRSLTNTILVTLLVVVGTLTTSVLGGYAFARLRFPGRDNAVRALPGHDYDPFVVLVTPMYQLMVLIGWDR
jgi:ABC-type glycerol-3-phosphate transport system permease component